MRSLFAIVKVSLVILATLTIYAGYIAGLGVLKLFRRQGDAWLNRILKLWGRSISRLLSIRVTVEGPIPSAPFFLVSNHLSYVDIIVLFRTLHTTFVAKAEIADWPVLGTIAKSVGIVFIDRKNKMDIARVNEEISGKVTDTRGLTLFPEGTTSPGEKLLRFRPSLLEYPSKSKLGVHYCVLHYSTCPNSDPAHETVCWWGDDPIHTHLYNLAKQKNINATITFGDNVLHDSDRKLLAEKLHNKMSAIFTPISSEVDTKYEPIQF
ncbi:1-acyl-sn-glycerol-3-phosphate acyltransferase [Rhodohalobacter sp. SW132]|uniref:lysophospholipid acyltransferase family protein n=1 Tax=Rhodohalobacter sp. SW132 TaxID=2293433 RepID=UPI000E228B48|nr:1-acyl-sn-glycerol-3-phosphate acyltransferase [Rhodohalobacter sp. SW132]REL38228.1 1-acyl-sn-glycerol-3-phosphate acyltransferase [Rhodohalobacter sp. SW132]